MRTLWLHIGYPKTGTTSIQHFLFHSDQALQEHGFHYLKCEPNHSVPMLLLFADQEKIDEFVKRRGDFSDDRVRELNDIYSQNWNEFLTNNSNSNGIICAEALSDFTNESIEAIMSSVSKHFDSVKIVLYVRQPVGLATSRAQQFIKTGTCRLNQLSVEGLVPHYRQTYQRYQTVLGSQNIIVRVYEKNKLIDGDIVVDFLYTIGLPVEIYSKDQLPKRNTSLCAEALHIIDEINRINPISLEGGLNPNRHYSFTSLANMPGTEFSLPSKLQNELNRLSAPEISWLNDLLGEQVFKSDVVQDANRQPLWSNPESLKFIAQELDRLSRIDSV